MTPEGLRNGSGKVESGGSKTPGAALPAAVAIASGNSKVQGRAKQTVDEIADQLKIRFQREGWISQASAGLIFTSETALLALSGC